MSHLAIQELATGIFWSHRNSFPMSEIFYRSPILEPNHLSVSYCLPMVEVAHSLTLITNVNIFHCPNLRSCSFAQNGLRLLMEFCQNYFLKCQVFLKTFKCLQLLFSWKGLATFLWRTFSLALLVSPSFRKLVIILNCNSRMYFNARLI